MSGEVTVWILLGILVFLVVVAVAVSLYRLATRTPPYAAVQLAQGPFALQVPPNVVGPVEVWIRYEVAFPFSKPSGGSTDPTFGLVLELVMDGHKIALGHGGRHPRGMPELEGIMHYMTSFTPGSDTTPTRYTASVIVKKLPQCPRTITGAVHGVSGTVVESVRITLEKA